MKRVVVDTNVLVSAALLPGSRPAGILRACRGGALALVMSLGITEELEDVFARPHIRKRFRVGDDEAREVLLAVMQGAAVMPGTAIAGAVPADPRDDHVISAAVEARADCIVTGDQHLLALGSYDGIRILTPAQFLEQLDAETPAVRE